MEVMAVIRVEAQVSTQQLLRAVDQMPTPQLERFVAQVLALRARREAPSLPAPEADLMLEINEAVPGGLQSRYDRLVARRRDERLTSEELEELLRLTDEIEEREARRVAALAELARLRRMPLEGLMRSLGIPAANDDR
jgi:hypothetical protein